MPDDPRLRGARCCNCHRMVEGPFPGRCPVRQCTRVYDLGTAVRFAADGDTWVGQVVGMTPGDPEVTVVAVAASGESRTFERLCGEMTVLQARGQA